MKTSFKISALVLAFAAFSLGAKAQTATGSTTSATTTSGIRYSIGVDAGIPIGDFNNTHSFNLGGSLQTDIPVTSQLFVTVNVGYNNFFGKSVGNSSINYTNINLLPVKAGLKFFPVQNFYVQGEAGASFLLNKNTLGATNSVAFVYAPQVGVLFPVSTKSFIDAGLRFESNSAFVNNGSNLNFIGVRLAYGFGL